jgi:antitoxin (DNA-binding transcriptional repressor) of toxin-antitoxin stability system
MQKEILSTRQVRASLSEVIMKAHFADTATVVTHHGKPYAVFVPIDALELLEKGDDTPE